MEMIMKESKFKVGDEVEFLENYCSFMVGERAKVMFVDTDNTVKLRSLDFNHKQCWVFTKRVKLLTKDPVLTPEEVFEHLRKGTELQYRRTNSLEWDTYVVENPTYKMITEGQWRIKPEPEVIELNGKRYKLIEE